MMQRIGDSVGLHGTKAKAITEKQTQRKGNG